MRIVWLLMVFGLVACQCGDKSDEEILRERIDTTSVHLYVAAKVAVAKADSDDPTVQAARASLVGVLGAANNVLEHAQPAEERPSDDAPGDEAPGDEAPGDDAPGDEAPGDEAPGDEEEEPVAGLSAADVLVLAGALYNMREVGAEIVRSESEDDLEPLLPALLRLSSSDPLQQRINLSTDHAVFFTGLWVLKVHPRVPTPVPQEILLYEASRIDVDELALPGMDILIYGLRSYTYATNELCDLAKRDADGLDAAESQLTQLFTPLGADSLSETQNVGGIAGLQALAHGSTAFCFFGRDEEEEAREELEQFVTAAERAGASPADLGLVRAYLAYHRDELAEARAQLTLAKEADWMTDERREDIDELIQQLDREDTDAIDSFFDRAFFARFAAELVLREADEAGLFDSLKETGTYRSVSRFLRATNDALASGTEGVRGAAEGAADGVRGAADRAGDLWNKVRGE